jgi:transcriptional regulator with XRE-family HTH domain
MEPKKLTQAVIAKRIGRTEIYLNALLCGRFPVNMEMALKIEKASNGQYDAGKLNKMIAQVRRDAVISYNRTNLSSIEPIRR